MTIKLQSLPSGKSVRLSEIDVADLPRIDDRELLDVIAERIGRPGMPWRGGRPYIEARADLRMIAGPGRRSKYDDLRQDPLVKGMLRRLTAVMTGAPYRVEPCTLPTWLEDDEDAAAARDRHHAYIERMWWTWANLGRDGLLRWLRDNASTTPVEGWSWYELVGTVKTVDLGDGPRDVLWLDTPPEWRSPGAVRYWIQDDERLVGVVADFYMSTDYSGKTGESWVVYPAEKMLLVTTGQVASNVTGESWLRAVANWLLAKRKLLQIAMVDAEVNGVGEIIVELPELGADQKDQDALQDYIDNRQSVAAPGMVVKHGTTVERTEPSKTDFSDLRDYIERQLAIAWGQDHRLIALQEAGAYSAREQAADEADDVLDDVMRELVCEPMEALFARLIRLSFPDDVERGWCFTPSLEWIDADDAPAVDVLTAAVQAGLLTWQRDDEAALREALGLGALPEALQAEDAPPDDTTPPPLPSDAPQPDQAGASDVDAEVDV